jgi:DNA processing protein
LSVPDDLDAWLRLLRTPGIGRSTARKLLASFGAADAVVGAGRAARRAVVSEAQADALDKAPDDHDALMQATRAWLAAGPARHIVVLGDAAFPPLLLESPDPPLLLYAIGRVEALALPSIAIVGSRNPSAQGRDNALAFAQSLAGAGLCVVSGLALGIDGAAHEGALAAGAPTIAVMGTGADRIYPARHRDLAHRIVDGGGLLVTEFEIGAQALAEHFPQRNRIIAGLARGTLVVEAALPSGSLSTARAAVDAGREVFAIPGSIHSPQSRGCHALIKQGAKLVESAADVLDELNWKTAAPSASAPSGETAAADPLLDALGHDPVTLDALAARTGESAAVLGARLLELELDGRVARLPGGLFQRRAAV